MITQTAALSPDLVFCLPDGFSPRQVVFFDIETTGFAADVTVLYLVGCIYFEDGCWKLIQWFADDNKSEERILTTFFQFIEPFEQVIHYNGTGFDLPYLARKCAHYHLDHSVPPSKSLDIFQKIRPYRSLFQLPNLKQRTVERYMGIQREDTLSGGDLIPLYGSYLKAKYGKNPEQEHYLKTMLLHNAEDLTGLARLMPVLAIPFAFSGCTAQVPALLDRERNELVLTLTLPLSLPKRIQAGRGQIRFSAFRDQGTLQIALYRQELKYFYSNYKDYYYLPQEDMAVHKSVAFYVDKEYRTRAKAANCYSKHTGCFVPQYAEVLSPFFKIDYHDKITYLETTEDFLRDAEALTLYARHLLERLGT